MCPKCGSAAAVHSIEEWAAMAQASMGYQWQPGTVEQSDALVAQLRG